MQKEVQRVAIRIPSWVGYRREVYRGIGHYITENNLQWDVETVLAADGELQSRKINDGWEGEGAILFRYSDEEAAAFKARNCPIVSISRVSNSPWVSRTHSDNYTIGKLAAEHLISTGSPLAVWVDPNRQYSVERKEGFLETARLFNRKVTVFESPLSLRTDGANKWKDIQFEMEQFLKSLPRPSSIFARDDISAAGLMKVAKSLGHKVPDDFAILGVGNDAILNSISNPTVSSVSIPGRSIGWNAAKLLHKTMSEPRIKDVGEVVELPCQEVIQRESTNQLCIQDSLVFEACRIIKSQNFKIPLTVRELCSKLGISETTLLKRFQRSLGYTTKKFIDNHRYTEAVRLLSNSSWSIKHLAYELGFRTPEEFDRFFKRHAKMSPSQFRSQD